MMSDRPLHGAHDSSGFDIGAMFFLGHSGRFGDVRVESG
jgi:hypothetical protein